MIQALTLVPPSAALYLRFCSSASGNAAFAQRNTIRASRRRHTRLVTPRAEPTGLSMMSVLDRQRISAGVSVAQPVDELVDMGQGKALR